MEIKMGMTMYLLSTLLILSLLGFVLSRTDELNVPPLTLLFLSFLGVFVFLMAYYKEIGYHVHTVLGELSQGEKGVYNISLRRATKEDNAEALTPNGERMVPLSTTPHLGGEEETFTSSAGPQCVDEEDKPIEGGEVFHIQSNIFSYHDAEPVCKSYGAQLATEEQVYEAQKKGAEWCSYGWTKGQMALYPTQECTWRKLQKSTDESVRNMCGKPGVNGGVFQDANKRFGVNCYGIKPPQRAIDRKYSKKSPLSHAKSGDYKMTQRIRYFKVENDKYPIAPFSTTEWDA